MADGITFKLTGDKALDAKFAAMPAKLQGQILRPALRAAAKVVLDRAKTNAPVRSGALRNSLKVRAGKRTRKGTVSITVQTGEGLFKGDEFYGGFVELGHRQGRRELGDARKMILGKHFMKQAADEMGDEAKDIAIAQIRAGILRSAG